MDRPIFYSVAVIIAGYLPIYVLHGPSGKLFHPMADTMSFALLGALILTLDAGSGAGLLLVQEGREGEAHNRAYEWIKRMYGGELRWCLEPPEADHAGRRA